MFSKPGILLRIEGAFVLAMSVFFYRSGGARWSFFFLFFLWPDLSMVGYLASAQLGSRLYNSVHAYIFPWHWPESRHLGIEAHFAPVR
jgi:hypothetical protein